MQANATALSDAAAATSACSICGTVNRANAEFCRCCGVSITRFSALTESAESGTASCGRCRVAHALPARFCDRCGGKLDRPLKSASDRAASESCRVPEPAPASTECRTLDPSAKPEPLRGAAACERVEDHSVERAAKAAVSQLLHGAPAKVTVVSDEQAPANVGRATEGKVTQARPVEYANRTRSRAANAPRSRWTTPGLLVLGAATLTGLGVYLTEQEKAATLPAMTEKLVQRPASEPVGTLQAEPTAGVPRVVDLSSSGASQTQGEALSAIFDESVEPGMQWTNLAGRYDVVRRGPAQAARMPGAGTSPALPARTARPVFVSAAQRELNYEPDSEIRVRPPLPLIEFQSVVRIDPPAN